MLSFSDTLYINSKYYFCLPFAGNADYCIFVDNKLSVMNMKYPQERIKPYDDGRNKAEQVEEMFDNIAPAYDRLNHTMSFGIDRMWRKYAIKTIAKYKPKSILDVATGTGDFAIQAYRMIAPEKITATDISEGMMDVGRRKVAGLGLKDRIVFMKEDSTALSFPDNSFDAITVAFGVRNFESLDNGLREMLRVLKPGGHLVILELSIPEHFPFRQIYRFHSSVIIPWLGRKMSDDGRAYTYLPVSIEAFPQGKTMKGIMENAGFKDVRYKHLTFGTCTMYSATK